MITNRRSLKPLLLAGIAGAAYYAYTRLTEEQKKNLTDSVLKYGKDLLGGMFVAPKTTTGDNIQEATEM